MAKKSAVENNKRRIKLVKQYAARRKRLKGIANNEGLPIEERFEARPRAFTGKMRMSRIALRELGSQGLIPGLVKSSW